MDERTMPPASSRTEAKPSAMDMMRAGIAEIQMAAMPTRVMSTVKPPAKAA